MEKLEKSVLIIQPEALNADELIREQLLKAGYALVEQTLTHLSPEAAQQFYELQQAPQPDDHQHQQSQPSVEVGFRFSMHIVRRENDTRDD